MVRINMRLTGENIRSRLKDKKITRMMIADRLCISRGAVQKWLNGNNMPTVDSLLNLCEVLDCSVEELIIANSAE